ncbi:MAG: hypothetical protein EHM89_02230 [Acidobacteria bacterium]|nr:MAG: hypothetical protein EHM89_02230 [Acidobacteriota bacterium]
MSAGHEDIHHHVKTYIGVFVALMVLTIITVAVSYLHLAVALAITVALVVATIKGSMVAAYFMHLKSERPAIYWVLVLPVIFWVHLMFIPVLMYLDHFGTNTVVR